MVMIVQSLWVLMLGMLGIFVVMGIIFLAITVLNRLTKRKEKDSQEQTE